MEIKRFGGTGRMSRVVGYNGTLYLSGLTAGNAGSTVEEQTQAVLAAAEKILEEHGSDKNHVLATTIYLKDMGLFQGMNSVWDAWVTQGNEPARATVEARLAADSILVEMSFTAAVK